MHLALHSGTISDLAREIYDMAQEDLDACLGNQSNEDLGMDRELRKRESFEIDSKLSNGPMLTRSKASVKAASCLSMTERPTCIS